MRLFKKKGEERKAQHAQVSYSIALRSGVSMCAANTPEKGYALTNLFFKWPCNFVGLNIIGCLSGTWTAMSCTSKDVVPQGRCAICTTHCHLTILLSCAG